ASKSFVSKSWTPTRSTSSDFTLTAYLRYHAFAICGGNFERVSPTEVNPFLSSIHATKPDWYFCA
ncbi:hypothetical protein JG687_00011258, partial [Phytophthora cactorum]